jgi:carboxyl-terminal processing protease
MSIRTRNTVAGVAVGLLALLFCAGLVSTAYLLGRNAGLAQTTPGVEVVNTPAEADAPMPSIPTSSTEESSDAPAVDLGADETDGVSQENEAEGTVEETVENEDEGSGEASATTAPTLQRDPPDLTDADLELMLEVWEIVSREYDGEFPTEDQITYEAIIGSLELLGDDYTRFAPPDLAARFREQLSGSFEGIGAFVDLTEDGFLLIVRPIEGQPADLAGLKEGDLVTHVDGESVLGKTLDEIVSEVKGPRGTEVMLTVSRENEPGPFDVTIQRDLIELALVTAEMLNDDVAYVHLSSFSSNAEEQLASALERLLEQSPRGLILDLRDNPGGFLSQSVEVADLFLPDGVVVFERNSSGIEEVFRSFDGDLAENIPLVVLVNAGSASASEIVAGAIQDRGRGVVVGEVTFGKGSVQQSHTLTDGSELRVTIARWYTPNNQTIDKSGVTPDIEVETPEEFLTETDSQLQRAIEYILTGR